VRRESLRHACTMVSLVDETGVRDFPPGSVRRPLMRCGPSCGRYPVARPVHGVRAHLPRRADEIGCCALRPATYAASAKTASASSRPSGNCAAIRRARVRMFSMAMCGRIGPPAGRWPCPLPRLSSAAAGVRREPWTWTGTGLTRPGSPGFRAPAAHGVAFTGRCRWLMNLFSALVSPRRSFVR
jgi:hypothetical protein